MSKRLNLSNFPPDMMYRLLTTVLFGNATTSFFRAQLRKLRGCARLGLTVIGNQKSKNQSRRGFQLHISFQLHILLIGQAHPLRSFLIGAANVLLVFQRQPDTPKASTKRMRPAATGKK